MVDLEWTPRLESAFKRLQDRKKSLVATAKTQQQHATFTPDETKTVQEVDALLARVGTPECVNLDLVKRVSALLLKYSSGSGDADSVSVNGMHSGVGRFSFEVSVVAVLL